MYGEPSDLRSFALWFQSHDGFVDASVMDITIFPGHGGRGAIALTDIPVRHHFRVLTLRDVFSEYLQMCDSRKAIPSSLSRDP
jgi:hypothetical protein